MVLRPRHGAFGGAWVFPGGAVDDVDHRVDLYGFDDPWRAAALREIAEEVGVFLTDPVISPTAPAPDVVDTVRRSGARFDPGRLRYVSTLVTPPGQPRRFHTRFYLAEVDAGTDGRLCDDELVDMRWMAPRSALDEHAAGTFPMIRPTMAHLRLMCATADPPAMSIDGTFRAGMAEALRVEADGGVEIRE